jgi:hypothetical protein
MAFAIDDLPPSRLPAICSWSAIAALLLLASADPSVAAWLQESAPRCIYAARPEAAVTIAGKLTIQTFAGPPNYESIAQGDAKEQAFILELPRRICLEDGEFADGSERFDRVHVYAVEPELIQTLQRAVGHEVTVMGRAVGAHTGHHRAPMVLFAGAVVVRENRSKGAENRPEMRPE